jgi:glycine cleavage system H protein
MNFPKDLRYTEEHEWVRVDGNTATVGVTDYAQDQLGDVVFLQLPNPGDEFAAGDTLGTVESVKAVSDIYSPLTGKIVEANQALTAAPERLNEDPYGAAWLVKMTIADPAELSDLMDEAAYAAFVEEESEG